MTDDAVTFHASISLPSATALVISLWAGYTVLQTLTVTGHVPRGWAAVLGFLPGVLGVAVLLAAGLTREDCYLAFQPISRTGLAVLAAVFLFALSAILPISIWRGWSWESALFLAPASGVSQELFFRASLLPALQIALEGRHRSALILHSVLFGLWHIAPLFLGAPAWAVIAVMFVPFLAGIGWGWQVTHDRTVLWAALQHSLIWVIALQFELVG